MGLRRYANGTPPLRQGYQQRGQPQRYHAGRADVAQLVERVHGKDEVAGSTPAVGSLFYRYVTAVRYIFCPRLSSSVLSYRRRTGGGGSLGAPVRPQVPV